MHFNAKISIFKIAFCLNDLNINFDRTQLQDERDQ